MDEGHGMTQTQQKWIRHVEAWQRSGQSLTAYCAAQGLKVDTLNRNRQKLERYNVHSATPSTGVALRKVGQMIDGKLARVHDGNECESRTIRLAWATLGIVVECGSDINEATLQTVVRVVTAVARAT